MSGRLTLTFDGKSLTANGTAERACYYLTANATAERACIFCRLCLSPIALDTDRMHIVCVSV